jgi:hypothetical protein
MKKLILFTGLFILLSGCVTTGIYHWGNYSDSLYITVTNPGPESMAKHQETLLHIIEKSEQQQRQVPPGVYYELGYLMYQDGHLDEASTYFELEVTTYPESAVFVNSYRQMLNRSQGEMEEVPAAEEVESERD